MEVSIGTVIVTCKDGHVYSWTCRGGTPQWLVRLDSPPTGPPLSDSKIILVPTEAGLRYLLPATGQELPQRRIELAGARHPAVVGSWLLLATGDRLSAFGP